MTLAIFVVVVLAMVAGYVAGRLDRAETDDVANRVLEALEDIYEARERERAQAVRAGYKAPRLDGCTCEPVAGAHRPGCPWSARPGRTARHDEVEP